MPFLLIISFILKIKDKKILKDLNEDKNSIPNFIV